MRVVQIGVGSGHGGDIAGDVEVTSQMAASPETIWTLIGDPSRMGEWSPECQRVTWTGDTSEPALHACVKGHNRAGIVQTLARIREAAEKSPD